MNLQNYKSDFPIFQKYPQLVYLDSAATSQKPAQVITSVTSFYEQHNSNIHRGLYSLSQNATTLFEESRKKIAEFIGVTDPSEIVFTGNTTEAINLVAYGWAQPFLQRGDYIVTTEMEHHSNLVPWIRLQEKKGITLIFLPVRIAPGKTQYCLDYRKLLDLNIDKKRIKLLAITHASNILGTVNPVSEISNFLKKNRIHAKILVDAAQSAPHLRINVRKLGCDFLAFSSHKMLGPSGVGVLWAKRDVLEEMEPLFYGSHMIQRVSKQNVQLADIPNKFESGTRNLEGVIGLRSAIDYLENIGLETIQQYEQQLNRSMIDMLKRHKNIVIYGPESIKNRLGVFSFNINGIHAHDVSEILNRFHIAVRTGHHCAQVLMKKLNQAAAIRASLYLYNSEKDIEQLSEGLAITENIFKKKM